MTDNTMSSTTSSGFCRNYLNARTDKCSVKCARLHEIPTDYVCKKCGDIGNHITKACAGRTTIVVCAASGKILNICTNTPEFSKNWKIISVECLSGCAYYSVVAKNVSCSEDTDLILDPSSICMRPSAGDCDWCGVIPATSVSTSYTTAWHYCGDCKSKYLKSVSVWAGKHAAMIFPTTVDGFSFLRKRTGVVTKIENMAGIFPSTNNGRLLIQITFLQGENEMVKSVPLSNIIQNSESARLYIQELVSIPTEDFQKRLLKISRVNSYVSDLTHKDISKICAMLISELDKAASEGPIES